MRLERARRKQLQSRCRTCGRHRELHGGADKRPRFDPEDPRIVDGATVICAGFSACEGEHHLAEVEAKAKLADHGHGHPHRH
jgi:hypothetical protein